MKYKSEILMALSIALGFFSIASNSIAQEDSSPRAARSVHLAYQAPDADIFYNEVKVEKSYPGTYFCTNGFNHGYFGIQEIFGGKKVVIFSVWDPGKQNNPDVVEQDRRVKVLHTGEGVRISRFGNEGTGGKSMFDYDWEVGQTYKFLIQAEVDGDRTTYAAYFYLNEEKKWKHLASFQTITGGDYLKGYYSFVEDFWRNGTSATKSRRAHYSNGWVRTRDGHWISLTRARFTADSTPTLNIDAGPQDDGFFLVTGGDTKNHTKLNSIMSRPPAGLDLPQPDDSNSPNQKSSKDQSETTNKKTAEKNLQN